VNEPPVLDDMPDEDIETLLTIKRQCRALRELLNDATMLVDGDQLRDVAVALLDIQLEYFRLATNHIARTEGRINRYMTANNSMWELRDGGAG
jgi:hypothetical protein